jgi:hypothetical protein
VASWLDEALGRLMDEQIVIDFVSRHTSGRRFQALASEYAEFVAELGSRWTDESPLPYEEFAIPYLEARNGLLRECDALGAAIRHAGDGQVRMAAMNAENEGR